MAARTIRGPFIFTDVFTQTAAGNHTVSNAAIVNVNKTVGQATTITLPAAGTLGRVIIVNDQKGDAATNNITVNIAGSGTLDGASSFVIAQNYGTAWFHDNGTEWNAIVGEDSTVTPGTAQASKPLWLDASKGVDTLTVGNTGLKLKDTAGDNTTTLKQNSDEASNRTVNLPALGADDTLALLGQANAFTARQTTTDGVAAGTARVIGGLAYSNVAASTAVASTSAETLFDAQYSVPANTLKIGSVVKIRFQGIATTTVASDTLIIKAYLGGIGGTALVTSSTTDAVNSDIFAGECTLVVRTAGTSGTFVASSSFTKVEAATSVATRVDAITASTTVNTTTAQVIGISATWNTANANSCRLDILTVEIT